MIAVKDIDWAAFMQEQAELDQLAQAKIPGVPSPNFIANFVRLQRAITGWTQDALAFLADVSLTTIQRIERAEAVSPEYLDRVALALSQKSGAFTEPRVPLTSDQLERAWEEQLAMFAGTIEVAVRPLRTQPQVAALARTHFNLIDGSRLGKTFESDVAELRETLGSVSFALGAEEKDSLFHIDGHKPVERRRLYGILLDMVLGIERRGRAVALAGTYTARTDLPRLLPTADVGLISFFSTTADPAAVKRKVLLPPARIHLKPLLRRSSETA
jgi:transcriptional regulator with XRE-family HTH domain